MNILITGGASGLGEAITRLLAQSANNQVFFTFNSSIVTAQSLELEFNNVKAIKCDFKKADDLTNLCAIISEMSLDVLINNAVTGLSKNHFHKLQPTDILDSFKYNVLPTISLTQACISHFRKQKSGKIITILSSAILNVPPAGWSEYVANKAYLHAMAKAWAAENVKFNITSNCVSPEYMQTSLTADTDERIVETMLENHPLKKLLTTTELADIVGFLLTASPHLNGTNIVVNSALNMI